MYKQFLGLMLISNMVFAPVSAGAVDDSFTRTVSSLQEQVNMLQAQVLSLLSLLAQNSGSAFTGEANTSGISTDVASPGSDGGISPPSPPPIVPIVYCPIPNINSNLSIGVRDRNVGSQVTVLQKFLVGQGFLLTTDVTGYFGVSTEKAVKTFQDKYNLVKTKTRAGGYGAVGPITRAKIAQICGIIVISPNGGETLVAGTSQNITWRDGSFPSASSVAVSYDVYLVIASPVSPPPPPCTQIPCLSLPSTPPQAKPECSDAIDNDGDGKIDYPADPDCSSHTDNSESSLPTPPPQKVKSYTIAENISGNLYAWTVGKVREGGVPEGSYRIRIQRSKPWVSYDDSDGSFTIQAKTTANLPPVVSGVSGPTTLKTGETGTWTVTASDPENGPLSYSVVWGDESPLPPPPPVPPTAVQAKQTATFTHNYAREGTYKPSFTVTDSGGLSAKTSISVVVGMTSAPSITVLSPNGGEMWDIGNDKTITWALAPNSQVTKQFAVELLSLDKVSKWTIFSFTPASQFLWKVGQVFQGDKLTTIQPGSYYVRVWSTTTNGKQVSDDSDKPFMIISAGQLAELKISPLQGLDKTVVAGTIQVDLGTFVFDATNAREDVRIAMAQVFADVISGDVDNFQTLQIFDGAKPLNTGSNVVNPASTIPNGDKIIPLSFDAPGLVVQKGTKKTLVLKGSITSSAQQGDKIKFDFSGSLNPDFWRMAYLQTGTAVNMFVSDAPGSVMTVTKNGGWSVSVAPSVPTEKWVAAGSTNVTVNVLRFSATTEDFALTDLRLQLKSPATGSDVAKISLWDGAIKLAEKVPSFVGGVEDFTFPTSGAGSFLIPKDFYKEMTVKVDVAGIGATLSGTAGRFIAIDFDGNGTPLNKNKALGRSSGMSLHASTATDTTSSGIRYFRSVPTVQRVSLPITALTSGNHVLYKFQVTADPAYDVALGNFTFTVATSGIVSMANADPSFVLRNITENKRVSSVIGWRAYVDNYSNYDSAKNLVVKILPDQTDYPNPWVIIPAGQTHTFELRANVTTDGIGDMVSTKLLGDSFSVPIGTYNEVVVSGDRISNFVWSDFSGDVTGTHSLSTRDWMNGYKVPWFLSTGLDNSILSN